MTKVSDNMGKLNKIMKREIIFRIKQLVLLSEIIGMRRG